MTKQELSHHVELRKRLAAELELLASLEAAAGPRAQRLDGLPCATGVRDQVGDCAAAIADAKEEIAQTEEEIARSESAIAAFISTIGDLQTRTIFRLRFLGGMAWKEVAAAIGGGNTEAGARMVCYRAVEIADMRETVAQREAAVTRSEAAVATYIRTIEDSQLRMVFRLRFIHGMTWKLVAASVGGRNTEAGVKAACYRYIARGGPVRMGRPPARSDTGKGVNET